MLIFPESKHRDSRLRSWLLCSGLVLAVALTIGLIGWLYSAPAVAETESTTTTEASPAVGADVGDPESDGEAVSSTGTSDALDLGAPVLYVDQNNCLSCHGDPDLVKKRVDGTSVSLYVSPDRLTYSIHRFLDCTTCHTDEPHEVESELSKLSLAQKCGSCHEFQYAQYVDSVHGADVSSGNSDPATCTDCHSAESSPHTVRRVLDQSASAYPKNIAETCAQCHDDPQLMGKYGIVERVYDSYMRSFHGKVMSYSGDDEIIGRLNTATCVNCHGSHNITSVTDPDSPVAGMENLAKTCEQCHPGAGVEFASGFLGHKDADSTSIPQVRWGERFFYWFTRAVLGAGVLMVAMPVGRMAVDRIRGKRAPGDDIEGTPKDDDPEAKDE